MSIANNIQASSQEILNDIQYLQEIEQGLFTNLETNTSLSSEQRQQILNNIDNITNLRINLYQTLSGVNGYFQSALTTSHDTLRDQSTAINIVEEELNRLKQNLSTLQTEKDNKLRLVQINSYFGDKYAEHSNLMIIIICTLLPIVIITVVNRTGLIPPMIYYIIVIIIAAIGGYFFWVRWFSIITRDPMNYNQYDWFFNAKSAPKAIGGNNTDPWLSSDLGICIGAKCCTTNQIYDDRMNKCIDKSMMKNMPAGSMSSGGSMMGSVGSMMGSVENSMGSMMGSVENSMGSMMGSMNNMTESFVNNALTKNSTTNSYKHLNKFSRAPQPTNPGFIYK